MKRTVHFNITIDTETASVEGFSMTEGLYGNTEFVMEGVDDPISIFTATQAISRELADMLE